MGLRREGQGLYVEGVGDVGVWHVCRYGGGGLFLDWVEVRVGWVDGGYMEQCWLQGDYWNYVGRWRNYLRENKELLGLGSVEGLKLLVSIASENGAQE